MTTVVYKALDSARKVQKNCRSAKGLSFRPNSHLPSYLSAQDPPLSTCTFCLGPWPSQMEGSKVMWNGASKETETQRINPSQNLILKIHSLGSRGLRVKIQYCLGCQNPRKLRWKCNHPQKFPDWKASCGLSSWILFSLPNIWYSHHKEPTKSLQTPSMLTTPHPLSKNVLVKKGSLFHIYFVRLLLGGLHEFSNPDWPSTLCQGSTYVEGVSSSMSQDGEGSAPPAKNQWNISLNGWWVGFKILERQTTCLSVAEKSWEWYLTLGWIQDLVNPWTVKRGELSWSRFFLRRIKQSPTHPLVLFSLWGYLCHTHHLTRQHRAVEISELTCLWTQNIIQYLLISILREPEGEYYRLTDTM